MATDPKSKSAPAGKNGHEMVDQQVIKALVHPVRARALAILNDRTASPNEIAKELGQGVGHVSYHINVLKKCGCIELVDTAPRRGAVEHYYRAISREDRHLAWTPMLVDEQGWADITAELVALGDRVLEIQAASDERLTATGEPGIQVSVASMAYETPADEAGHPAPPQG
jgi:DNA-binding transcriptional ArsR family regulator